MKGRRLRNKAVSELPSSMQTAWQAERHSKQYVELLVNHCVARASAREWLNHLTADIVSLIEVRAENRKQIIQRLKQYANEFQTRQVRPVPPLSEDDRHLPAALLAERRRAWHDMTRLRLASGKELSLKVDQNSSLQDFHLQARDALCLPMNVSFVLLRVRGRSVEERLLENSPHIHAWEAVKGQVFDVVVHEVCEEDDETIISDDDEIGLEIVAVFPLWPH